MENLRPGTLLIATVDIADSVFAQTVILLLDADESGALGVIVNRISDLDLEDVLPQWKSQCSDPARLFDGGPVSKNGAVCLAVPHDPSWEPPGWREVFGDIGLLHLDTPVELVDGAFEKLRIFAGYAGWAPGQLEGELLRGSWYVTTALPAEIFDEEPATLWRRVLHRQAGDVAIYSTWPKDPESN